VTEEEQRIALLAGRTRSREFFRWRHPAGPGPEPNDPTPDEIAAACEAFQATWSEAERRSRCVHPGGEVEVYTLRAG
jgi:hypothetical protein